MDLVNDLSCEVALAVFVEGMLQQKLDARDAKTFIAMVEAELVQISAKDSRRDNSTSHLFDLSH